MDGLHKKIEYKINILYNNLPDKRSVITQIHDEYSMIYANNIINKNSLKKLIEIIISENIIERINALAEDIQNEQELKKYTDIKIELKLNHLDTKFCNVCQCEMELIYDSNLYICEDCYITDTIESSEKILPRSKIGNFNPERHFKTWIDRILARESIDEICTPDDPTGEKIINEIRQYLIRKSKSKSHLTIDDIRNILKELGKTNLNRNTSLISKFITGRSPPKLCDNKYNQIYTLFLKVMDVRDKLSINHRCNRIYYPYYIQKILSIFLETPEERKILNYIHLECGDGKAFCHYYLGSNNGKTVRILVFIMNNIQMLVLSYITKA